MRVLFSREDVVRLGAKRPPIAATACYRDNRLTIMGVVAGDMSPFLPTALPPEYHIATSMEWHPATVTGPPTASTLRAVGLAEVAVLREGALTAANLDRVELVWDERTAGVLLDTCVATASGAEASALSVSMAPGRMQATFP